MDGKPNIQIKKILQSPKLKRRSRLVPVSEKVTLERVLGLTCHNNTCLDTDPHTGTVAYPAGCVVVLYNPRKNKQSHLFSISKKTITCLAFSRDGKHLVTGESGHQPAVRVWDVEDKIQVAELQGHKFGVSCVAFSPNLKYLVSIGTQHDMQCHVWNWRTQSKIASNKVAAKVSSLAFSEDGSTFVTVGNRHVKFWYLDYSKSKIRETVPLSGRSGILGEQKDNFFCDVVCGRAERANSTYCITKSGLLCEFNEKRLLDKWVELRTNSAYCLTVGEDFIYIGCADGIIRVFGARSLHFVTSLPRPHYLGVDVAAGMQPSDMIPEKNNAKYPDVIAISVDDAGRRLTCVYNDHSFYQWDVREVHKVGKSRSFLYHSGCIWGLEMYPNLAEKSALPEGSFITCSSDDTIRVWNCDPHMDSAGTAYRRNIYSNELLKIVYTDSELSNIMDIEYNPAGKNNKTDNSYLDKCGVRSVKISPDGQHLASGDRVGNIRVHTLSHMEQLYELEAHDSEILCLQYTDPKTGVNLLASTSRDRFLHVFDKDQDYGLVQTLDDHSSAITAVSFSLLDGQLHMLSCGADKSLLFRSAQQDPDFQFVLNRHLVGKTTLYDMDVDPTSKFVATACQDRNMRIYSIKNGKQKKCYSGSIGNDGTLIRVRLDPSGMYAASSCSDKNLGIFDFFTGEMVASMQGHSEIATGIQFTNDLKYLVSVAGDGCIFMWKLPAEFTENMRNRMTDLGQDIKFLSMAESPERGPRGGKVDLNDNKFNSPPRELNSRDVPDSRPIKSMPTPPDLKGDYRFSVGHLPTWAKKQVSQEPCTASGVSNPVAPKGKWAERVEDRGIVMKSVLDNSSIQLSLADCMADRRRMTVEPEGVGDPVRDIRRDTMVISKSEGNYQVPIITDDENNQDDDDDDFRPQARVDLEKRFQHDANLFGSGKVTMSRGQDLFQRKSLSTALSLELADSDEEDKDVIFYPPSKESESSDTLANSFQVYAGDTRSLAGVPSICVIPPIKEESEGTDPQSLSDEEADSDPRTPSTPIDPTKDFAEGENFLRNNFENLATPDTFSRTLETIEKEMHQRMNQSSSYVHPRLSISARFLSRAQQRDLRSNVLQNGQSRLNSSQYASLQKKKEEVARAVDETRKKLAALGWKVHKGDRVLEDPLIPTPDLSSPSYYHHLPNQDGPGTTEPTQQRGRASLGGQKSNPLTSSRSPSMGTSRRVSTDEKPVSLGTPTERRKWDIMDSGRDKKWKSMLDLSGRLSPVKPLTPTPERRSATPTAQQSSLRARRSSTPSPLRFGSPRTLPSPSKTSTNRTRTRTMSTGSSNLGSLIPQRRRQVTKTELKLESPSKTRSPKEDSISPTGSSKSGTSQQQQEKRKSLGRQHSYQMQTRSSQAKVSKTTPNGSSTNKENEGVTNNATTTPTATATTSQVKKESKKSSGPRRGRLSMGMKAKYQSTPNLAEQFGEKEELSLPGSATVDDLVTTSPKAKLGSKALGRRSLASSRDGKDLFTLSLVGRGAGTSPPRSMSSTAKSASDMLSAMNTREMEKMTELVLKPSMDRTSEKGPSPGSTTRRILPQPRLEESQDAGEMTTPLSVSASNSSTSKEDPDKLAMPPPSAVPSTKSDPKKVSQPKRKSNTPELTLAQAKQILLGKSSFLGSKKSETNDSVGEPTTTSSKHELTPATTSVTNVTTAMATAPTSKVSMTAPTPITAVSNLSSVTTMTTTTTSTTASIPDRPAFGSLPRSRPTASVTPISLTSTVSIATTPVTTTTSATPVANVATVSSSVTTSASLSSTGKPSPDKNKGFDDEPVKDINPKSRVEITEFRLGSASPQPKPVYPILASPPRVLKPRGSPQVNGEPDREDNHSQSSPSPPSKLSSKKQPEPADNAFSSIKDREFTEENREKSASSEKLNSDTSRVVFPSEHLRKSSPSLMVIGRATSPVSAQPAPFTLPRSRSRSSSSDKAQVVAQQAKQQWAAAVREKEARRGGQNVGSPDVEEEVKRPDKSRSSPPTSLTTALPSDAKQSQVVLKPPSPPVQKPPSPVTVESQPSSPSKPDRNKLSLTLETSSVSPSSGSATKEGSGKECDEALSNFSSALQKVLDLHAQSDTDGSRHIEETLRSAASKIHGVVGPTPGPQSAKFHPLFPTNASAPQTPITPGENTDAFLDHYSVQLCEKLYDLFEQKLGKSRSGSES